MNYLFICKYNRFRSKVAEAYFKQINSQDQVKSAGLIKGTPIDEEIKQAARESNLNNLGKTRKVNNHLLSWADKIIIVADNVPTSIFKNKDKLILWEIPDVDNGDFKGRLKAIGVIKKKIDQLIKKLQ